MFNTYQKVKKPIKDPKKLQQIDSWKQSDLSKVSSSIRRKERASFDTTTEFLDNCINFNKEEIEFMLNLGFHIDCADKDNLTALHQACINAKLDLVIYLLNKNANINAIDKEGWTPLHIAASIGSLEMAKTLIDRGARLDIVNYDGDIPIAIVDEKEYPDLKDFFLSEMNKRNINEAFCRNMERKVMMEDVMQWKSTGLYKPPIDDNIKFTPLHVAASKNYFDILVELTPLLTKNELNARDMDGWTALHAAAHWGNRDACLILMKAGADLDAVTKANESVLDITDPQLKDALTEDIRKFKENVRTIAADDLVPIRNEGPNKRSNNRTSIARQSLQMKKYAQSKDPVMERQIHDAARNCETSSATSSIDEDFNQPVSPRSNNKLIGKEKCVSINEGDESSISQKHQEDLEETKSCSTISVTSPCISYENNEKPSVAYNRKDAHTFDSELNDNVTKPLSDGDNDPVVLRHDNSADNEFNNNENNIDVNNTAASDISDESSESKAEEVVQMRPKSGRLSLVMAPSKCAESEANRREKSRRVRSFRRSTQAIDLENVAAIAARQHEIENGGLVVKEKIAPIKEEGAVDFVDTASTIEDTGNIVIDHSKSNLETTPSDLSTAEFSNMVPKMRISFALDSRIKLKSSSSNNSSNNVTKPAPSSVITTTPSTRLDINTASKQINMRNNTGFDSRITPIDRFSCPDGKNVTKELDSGSFVARPSRVKSSDTMAATNQSAYTSDISKVKPEPKCLNSVNSIDCISNDDSQSCRSIAHSLANSQIIIKDQNNEILKLNMRIVELEKSQRNPIPGNVVEESEFNRIMKENKTLKAQNESLLRVIGKIQQELHSIKNIELPK